MHTNFDSTFFQNGKTALLWAIEYGHVNIVKEILKCNPNVELLNHNKETALLFAVRHGNLQIVKAIAAHGANLAAQDCVRMLTF